MDPITSGFLGLLVSYLVSLAANESSAAIHQACGKRLRQRLAEEESLRSQLARARNVRQQVGQVASEVARNRAQMGVTPQEEPLFALLLDETFQAELAEWLMAGGIEEGRRSRESLASRMAQALSRADRTPRATRQSPKAPHARRLSGESGRIRILAGSASSVCGGLPG